MAKTVEVGNHGDVQKVKAKLKPAAAAGPFSSSAFLLTKTSALFDILPDIAISPHQHLIISPINQSANQNISFLLLELC